METQKAIRKNSTVVRGKSPFIEFCKIFSTHRLGMIGLTIIVFILLIAIFGPLFTQDITGYGQKEDILNPPSSEHWFGTDSLGLDVFSQVIIGTRISIKIGIIAITVASIIGVTIGLAAGVYGGKLEIILMGITDIFLTIPILPIMIIIAAIIGSSVNNVAFVIGFFSWPKVARVTRSSALKVMGMQYIEAARALGISNMSIFFRHVLINASAPILVNMTVLMAAAIISESGLSFLGLGDPVAWSWGKILNNAQLSGTFLTAWWCSFFPSLAIMIYVIAFNFFGMGVQEALNPRLRERS